MAHLRISMRKIREILRLKYELGLSDRQTAESCGISRRTVSQYWKQAQKNGIDWSKAQGLTDTELEQELFQRRPTTGKKIQPDWNHVYRELKRPHVTLQLLWQEYKEENPEGLQHSWFNEHPLLYFNLAVYI